VILVLRAGAASAGIWFDIGGGYEVSVYADGSPQSFERFRPCPFGPFPPGSLVYEDVRLAPCEELGAPEQICGQTRFVRGFEIYFYGVSCGCGGALSTPTQLRFGYDPLEVSAARASEESLVLLCRDEDVTNWTPMPAARLDLENHCFTVAWNGNVLGTRQSAILTHDITPVAPDSWGRVKSLYRR